MKEQDAWQLATELWQRRGKIKIVSISIATHALFYNPKVWFIELWYQRRKKNEYISFRSKASVRRFLGKV